MSNDLRQVRKYIALKYYESLSSCSLEAKEKQNGKHNPRGDCNVLNYYISYFTGVTKDTETQGHIVSGLRSVSMSSSKLLMSTKTMMADPNAPNAKNLLAQAAR